MTETDMLWMLDKSVQSMGSILVIANILGISVAYWLSKASVCNKILVLLYTCCIGVLQVGLICIIPVLEYAYLEQQSLLVNIYWNIFDNIGLVVSTVMTTIIVVRHLFFQIDSKRYLQPNTA